MNVFVLCTGRCGSYTFHKACTHIANFTTGHELLARKLGKERFAYPDNHIEVDNRLSWMLGRLDQKFGNRAFYVHLTREPDSVIRSYEKRTDGVIKAYRAGIMQGAEGERKLLIAQDMVLTMDKNIKHFLKYGNKVFMTFDIENYQQKFATFWELIGAEGDYESAKNEFRNFHNSTLPREMV